MSNVTNSLNSLLKSASIFLQRITQSVRINNNNATEFVQLRLQMRFTHKLAFHLQAIRPTCVFRPKYILWKTYELIINTLYHIYELYVHTQWWPWNCCHLLLLLHIVDQVCSGATTSLWNFSFRHHLRSETIPDCLSCCEWTMLVSTIV